MVQYNQKGGYYMNDKEKELEGYKYKLIVKLLKSLLYTILTFFFTIFIVLFIVESVFGSNSDTSVIISFHVSAIFIIFYYATTIVDEIKKLRK